MLIVSVSFLLLQQFTQAAALNLVTIPTDGNGGCPVQEKRDEVIQNITADIMDIIRDMYAPLIHNCGEGEWYQVAYLNMSDSTQQCPSAWREYNSNGIRSCARPTSGGCPGNIYHVDCQYSRICGRVIGYQFGSTDAFSDVPNLPVTVDKTYLNGISITHGIPRVHIWSFVGGLSELVNCTVYSNNLCPCSGGRAQPSFVGNNFYCESAYQGPNCYESGTFFPNDPLWDGQQCNNEGTCCTGDGVNTPPWFSVALSNPTSDDIEVRICHNADINNEDTPISFLEIFVQ